MPPGVAFLDAIADDWLQRAGPDPLDIARGLILLPTRRAARALAEAFLRVSGGNPLLLPRITAFGGSLRLHVVAGDVDAHAEVAALAAKFPIYESRLKSKSPRVANANV